MVDINKSDYGFKPDVENNQILFGMKALLNVSDESVKDIIKYRPYTSPKDFYQKVNPKKQTMISLIKSGAFDNMMDRKECMVWYLWETCDKKKRLTLQNLPGLIKYQLLPEDTEQRISARRVYEFNRYLKSICKYNATHYKLDERAIDFIQQFGYDDIVEDEFLMSIKKWDKYYQKWMDVFRDWISSDKDNILNNLNTFIFEEAWNKYAKKNTPMLYSAWEMETMCFYYHPHELERINKDRYGFSNFFNLPTEPKVVEWYERGNKRIPIFKLEKICGTCIAKNKVKSTVSLLTTSGVVNVKFRKEYFTLFDKQLSEKQLDGTKKVIEKSFFNRGNMIVVTGIRSGDDFIVKKYASTPGHQLYKIDNITDEGELILKAERGKINDN